MILIDDIRWDGLHCTGHPFAKSPHIDHLAKEGAIFQNMFVSIPLCSPSRSCFLTRKYAHSTGVLGNANNDELSHKLITFPKLLHDAGYATAFFGKWHIGTDDDNLLPWSSAGSDCRKTGYAPSTSGIQ